MDNDIVHISRNTVVRCGELERASNDFTKGKRDGLIANSGPASNAVKYKGINAPGSNYRKNEVEAGKTYPVNWSFGAAHTTINMQYYITKDGWDPNDGLQWSDFEPTPIQSYDYKGKTADSIKNEITIPEGKSGYNVVAYEWNVVSPQTQWVSVIDLNISASETPVTPEEPKEPETPVTPEEPETPLTPEEPVTPEEPKEPTCQSPTFLHAMGSTTNSADLMWNMVSDCKTYKSTYEIYQNDVLVATTNNSSYKAQNLAPNTKYNFKVVDKTNNKESRYSVTTKEEPNTSTCGTWKSNRGTKYKKGQIVCKGTEKKQVVQDFVANGDPNWYNAPSLFSAVR